MKKLLILFSILIALCIFNSCTDEEGARKALISAGYKPISVGGYGWFDGSKDDFFVTKFKAYSPNDSTIIVEGVVCSGLFFKSSTIRTY